MFAGEVKIERADCFRIDRFFKRLSNSLEVLALVAFSNALKFNDSLERQNFLRVFR